MNRHTFSTGDDSAAMQGNQSIMNVPLQTPGLGGLLGGLAGGLISKLPTFWGKHKYLTHPPGLLRRCRSDSLSDQQAAEAT